MSDGEDERVILGHIGKLVEELPPTPVIQLFAGRGTTPPPNVRPCEHHAVTLDEEMMTATCQKCGERVEPFAVLLRYAREFERHRNNWRTTQNAHRQLLVAELREMRERRALTSEERAEVEEAMRSGSVGYYDPERIVQQLAALQEATRKFRHILLDRRQRRTRPAHD